MLRPGWLALAAVVALFAYLCFSVLAPWQLGKNTETSQRNELINASVEADPVAITELSNEAGFDPEDEWRRVVATGRYLPDREALVRLRSIQEKPAYEVITPFQLDDGRTILVNRGYVLPVRGTEPPPIEAAPSSEVTLDARLRRSEGTSREPIVEAGQLQVYNIAPAQIGPAVGVDALDGYLQLAEGQPGGLGVIALPQTDSGPYLSYGLQWLAFGIMAPLGLAYFVRAELRERRKSKQQDIAREPSTDAPGVGRLSDEFRASDRSRTTETRTTEPGTTQPGTTKPPADEFRLPTRKERAKARKGSAPRTANDVRLAERYGKNR